MIACQSTPGSGGVYAPQRMIDLPANLVQAIRDDFRRIAVVSAFDGLYYPERLSAMVGDRFTFIRLDSVFRSGFEMAEHGHQRFAFGHQ